MKFIFTSVFFLLLITAGYTQNGVPDPTFGTGGAIMRPAPQVGAVDQLYSKQAFVNTDGTIAVVMQRSGKTVISKRLTNGLPDLSYRNQGFSDLFSVNMPVAAIQPDGKIVLAGTTDGSSDWMLARVNTDGSSDASFGNAGVVIVDMGTNTEFLNAVTIDPSGRILLVGQVNPTQQTSVMAVARYLSNGTPDNNFGTNGKLLYDFGTASATARGIVLQQDGKIILTGSVYTGSYGDFAIARLNSNGSPDNTFNGNSRNSFDFIGDDYGVTAVVNSTGEIFLGGFSTNATGWRHFRIMKISSAGLQDLGYNNGEGSLFLETGDSYDALTGLRLLNDGKLLASGFTQYQSANYNVTIIRVNTNGTLDNSFGANGYALGDINGGYDESSFLQVAPDGKILAGGYNSSDVVPGEYGATCFRFTAAGLPDNSFGTGGSIRLTTYRPWFSYSAIVEQPDGKVLAVGEKSAVNANLYTLERFTPAGSVDNTFGQGGVLEMGQTPSLWAFQPDGKVLRQVFDEPDKIKLYRYSADGTPDATFGVAGLSTIIPGATISVNISFQPDGKIILAGNIRNDTGGDLLVMRLNADGTLDNSFGTAGYTRIDTGLEEWVSQVVVLPDGKLVLGGSYFSFSPDYSILYFDVQILRLTAGGLIDPTFGNQGKVIIDRTVSDVFNDMILQDDGKIIINYTSTELGGRQQLYYLERLNADGSADNGFAGTGRLLTPGYYITKRNDGSFFTYGRTQTPQNNYSFAITQYSKEGAIDAAFGSGGTAVFNFTGLDNDLYARFVSGNNFFAAGSGMNRKGETVGLIAKINLGNSAPAFGCPADKTVNTDNNLCTAKVTAIDPAGTAAVTYRLSGATTGSGNGSASGRTFNRGVTVVTYKLVSNPSQTCSFKVTVQDAQKPSITNLSVSGKILWPADHNMKEIVVNYTATDNCQLDKVRLSVTSNEPVATGQRGDQSPDWQVLDDHRLRLRAERLETGNGRVYTVTVTALDKAGNSNASTVTVEVPKQYAPNCNLQVTASPNPSSNYFRIALTSACPDNINLRVLNSNGVVILTRNNLSPNQSLNIGQNFNRGIYYLEVKQGSVTKSVKLIKQ